MEQALIEDPEPEIELFTYDSRGTPKSQELKLIYQPPGGYRLGPCSNHFESK
jgi:hypothetical protein